MMGKIALASVMLSVLLPSAAFAATYPLDFQGSTVDVNYETQGVIINNIQPDFDFISLIIDVDVTGSPGILEITFERDFFDSLYQGIDDDFIVIVDADEAVFNEIDTNLESRTLRIELPNGTDEVEIIGTEFGTPSPSAEPEPTQMSETEEMPGEPEVISEPEIVPEPEITPQPETEMPTTPVVEPKTQEQPKIVCGAGTVLKDGLCVIEKKCGSGTILQDGACVVDPNAPVATKDSGRELVIATIAAFIIGLAVIFVLWLISKA